MSFPRDIIAFFASGINDRDVRKWRPPRSFLRFFWSHPHLYKWYTNLCHNIDIFAPAYDLVFDGFPRSGNTYGSRMLVVSQDDRIKVLSNSHCPPFLLAALELNVPVCLTLRRPEDSIVSWVILKKKLPIDVVVNLYIDFYSVMLPYRSQVLVAPFTLTTQDFPTLVRLINHRFGLSLTVPEEFTVCEKEAFLRIDRHYENEPKGYDPLKVARPHPERDKFKSSIHEELMSGRYKKSLAQCHHLYQIFHEEYQRERNKFDQSFESEAVG